MKKYRAGWNPREVLWLCSTEIKPQEAVTETLFVPFPLHTHSINIHTLVACIDFALANSCYLSTRRRNDFHLEAQEFTSSAESKPRPYLSMKFVNPHKVLIHYLKFQWNTKDLLTKNCKHCAVCQIHKTATPLTWFAQLSRSKRVQFPRKAPWSYYCT